MAYRLLVDLEAIAVLDALPKRYRNQLIARLREIQSTPDAHSDYHEQDAVGRRIEITVSTGYAIHYWIDFADRHVKILAISPAGS